MLSLITDFPESALTRVSLAGDNGVRADLQQALEKVNTQCCRFWRVDVFKI